MNSNPNAFETDYEIERKNAILTVYRLLEDSSDVSVYFTLMKVKLYGIRVVLESNDSDVTTVYLVVDDIKIRIGSSTIIEDIYSLEQEARNLMLDIMEVAEMESQNLREFFPGYIF